LGVAILCLALGLGDLAALNIWGIPWGWPTLAERRPAPESVSARRSLLPAQEGVSVARTPELGERGGGDNSIPLTEGDSLSGSQGSPVGTSDLVESVPEPAVAMPVEKTEAAVVAAEETDDGEPARGVGTEVQDGSSPGLPAADHQPSIDVTHASGSEVPEKDNRNRPDPYALVASPEPEVLEAQKGRAEQDLASLSEPVAITVRDADSVDEGWPDEEGGQYERGNNGDGVRAAPHPDPLDEGPQAEMERAAAGVPRNERGTRAPGSRDSPSLAVASAAVPPVRTEEEAIEEPAPSVAAEPISIPATDLVIRFATAQFALNHRAVTKLEQIAVFLRQRPELHIKVEGHTDRRGTFSYNEWLGERRAAVVASFLKEKGIAEDRIEHIGLGSSKPVDARDNPGAWAKNRRVEIRITRHSL